MIEDSIKKEVLFRLKLAQDILEDSDKLGGHESYPDDDEDEWWKHPRHTRESLSVYLLLTCFDKLGQPEEFLTFKNWLSSKQKLNKDEVQAALQKIPPNSDIVESARILSEYHQNIYGVKKAFYKGIDLIPEKFRINLLSSINICTKPDFGKTPPNVSTPGVEITDKSTIEKLRYKYLYEKRNRFTHDLEQYHSSSSPYLAGMPDHGQAAWVAEIRNSKLNYWGVHQEYEPHGIVGAYCYSISNWPFVLFEAIYAAIDMPFDRTDINIKFQVKFKDEEKVYAIDLPHKKLKDIKLLEKEFKEGKL